MSVVATAGFVVITGPAVFGAGPAPTWHSRVLLPLLVVAVIAGAATASWSPAGTVRRTVVAAVAALSCAAAALYSVIGLHREQGCMQAGVPDPADQQAAVDAHLTGEQLTGWTDFEMRLIAGEMICQRTDGVVAITHRVDVLALVRGSAM